MKARKPLGASNDVLDDKFLHEQLATFEAEQKEFFAQKLTAEQLESHASRSGYRTYRIALQCIRTQHLLLQRFVNQPAFARLWQILNQCDQSMEEGRGFSFSPANGGFPACLFREVDCWYQAPKFTKREREAARRRMMLACDVLLSHLHQLSAGGPANSFAKLNRPEPWQLEQLFGHFGTKEKYQSRLKRLEGKAWPKFGDAEAYALNAAGITPAFAIQSLRDTLERDPERHARMPTKIRASGAMKTHFIEVVDRLLHDATLFANPRPKFALHHIAELVSLITNSDCSLEDVHKARIVNRKNEMRRQEDFQKELAESSIGD